VQRQTGHQPKILAYIKVKELYGHSPLLSASGSGPGEFTSIPQTWASEAIRRISVQAVPPVPGLFSSSYYVEHIAPLSDITFESTYAISSSLNKPYSGISTLLAEWGLLGTAVLGYLFYKRARHLLVNSRDALAVICFFIVLNLVDLWTDSLWFGFCMLLFTGVVEFGPTLVAQKTASVSSAGDGESPRGQARRGVVSRPS
jgi:hypothetical protein